MKFNKYFNSIVGATAIATMTILNPISMSSSLAEDGQTTGTNFSEEKVEDSQKAKDIANLNLAYNLAEYGRKNKDPQMLINAAKIIMETPVESLSIDKTTEEEEIAEGEQSTKQGEKSLSLEGLLAEAKELSNNDSTIIALIDSVEKNRTTSRGRVGGATRHIDTVLARSTDTYTLRFRGDYTDSCLMRWSFIKSLIY